MKKLKKWFTLLTCLASLGLMGCSNLVSDATVTGDDLKINNTRTLILTATGDSNLVSFKDSSSRMILPSALDGENLKFYLWGTNKLDSTDSDITKPRLVDFYATSGSNGREGSVELDLPTSQYELYLAALTSDGVTALGTLTGTATTDQGNVKKYCSLFATATVDMRYNERVSFYLSPFTASGTGNVKLKVYTNWTIGSPYTNGGGTMTIGMYKLTDDSVVAATTPASTLKQLTSAEITALNSTKPASENYVMSGVAAGTYNFKVTFVNTDVTPNKKYVWSDTILVLPNQDTTGDVVISNVIGTVPKAPTNFTARYVEAENSATDSYDVQFLWEDNSDNEQYFQIELMELGSGQDFTLPSTSSTYNKDFEASWGTMAALTTVNTLTTLNNSIYSDSRYLAGNLNANSTMVTMKLHLGTRYIARICAVNDAGNSIHAATGATDAANYLYEDLKIAPATIASVTYTRPGQSTAVETTAIKQFSDGAATPSYSDTINRFRITYNLVGGNYYKAEYTNTTSPYGKISAITSGTTASQTNITTLNGVKTADIRYYTQFAAGNTILNPLRVENEDSTTKTSTPAFALLKNAKNEFTGWKLNGLDGTTLWMIDPSSTTETPDQKLMGSTNASYTAYYKDSTSSTKDWNYPGFTNLALFAVYGSAAAHIENPADHMILDQDVFVYKGDAFASGIQVATLDDSNSFKVNVDGTAGYKNVYVAVRNENYYKVEVSVVDQTNGVVSELTTGTSTTINADRYVLTSSKPSDWSTAPTNYYTKSGRVYTAVTGTPTWASGTYYYKDAGAATDKFTYFELPARTNYAPGAAYLIYVKGYSDKLTSTPYTYVFCMNLITSSTASYTATTFAPLNYDTVLGNYFKDATGTANDAAAWSTAVLQKD